MKELPYHAHETTYKFLKAALKDSRHPIETVAKKNPLYTNIVGVYYSSPASTKEISEQYGLHRVYIGAIVKKTMADIWDHSSKRLRQKFPLEDIPLHRPWSIRQRRNKSQNANNRSYKVEQLVIRHPEITAQEIKKRLHLTGLELGSVRDTLKRREIEVPYVNNRHLLNRQLAEQLISVKNRNERSRILSQINQSFFNDPSRRQLLVPLKTVANGFHYSNRDAIYFVHTLKRAKIFVVAIKSHVETGPQTGIRHYYTIARQELKLARRVLKANPSLERFRDSKIAQICGPTDRPPPTAYNFWRRNNLISPGKLLMDMGIRISGPNPPIRLKEFFTPDCPVAVFRYGSSTYNCWAEDKNKMRQFLHQKHRELLRKRVQKPRN